MRKISPWTAVAAVVASAALVGTAAFAADPEPSSAAISNPTQAEALAANETVRNYIQAHPDAPVPTPTGTTASPTPTTTSPTPTNEAPSDFKAAAGDQKIVLTWAKPSSGTPTGYRYGRDGVDATGYGAWTSDVVPTSTTSATLDKLVNGRAYGVFVEAVYASGAKRVSATATPRTASTPTPTTTTASPTPTTTTTPPTPGNRPSGLTWSSGVWTNQTPADTARFVSGPRGGRDVDNVLIYTSRNNMAAQNNPNAWRAGLPSNFNGTRHDLVLAVTTWTSDGAFMNASQAAGIAASMCSVDSVRPIARIDWEMNLQDGAGVNGAVLTASNYSAWVARFRAVATAMQAAPCDIQVDFNPNYGVDQTSGCNSGTYAWPNNCTRRAFQALKDVVDIYGIDTYDSYPPVRADGSGWNARLTGNNALEESRKYAVANGKKWSVPEWGVACNGGGCQWQGNAGGDDPEYIKRMLAYFAQHAGDMAYETYFNEPASYIVSDLISANPNSRAQYRSSLLAQ
jgi:hypothetical protein